MYEKYKILISGANRFIGKAFIDFLADSTNHMIYGLDTGTRFSQNNLTLSGYIQQDIANKFKIYQKFDYVFHFAALNQTHIGNMHYECYYKTNVLGTEHLIDAVKCEKFVFMSTAKVYAQNGKPIDENSELNPVADYEKSKLMAEELCKQAFKKNKLIILRPVNIAGFGQATKALLPIIFQQAISNKLIEVFAPQKKVLQLLYIKDVLEVFKKLLELKDVAGVFNLASKDKVCLDDLALQIIEITGSESKINFSNLEQSVFSEIIALKAKEYLKWEPKIKINEIIKMYYRDLLSKNNLIK